MADKPPIKNNSFGQLDTKPIMTSVAREGSNDISPGFFISQHVLNRLIALRPMDTALKMQQPLYVNQSGEWLQENEAKKVFKRVVKQALTLRDGKPPSAASMKKFTLYSNKVGKKVHLDYSKNISGTETRFIGGWAPIGGDADYSRPLPSHMCKAHKQTNNMILNTLH